jgi:hypothetical protein
MFKNPSDYSMDLTSNLEFQNDPNNLFPRIETGVSIIFPVKYTCQAENIFLWLLFRG